MRASAVAVVRTCNARHDVSLRVTGWIHLHVSAVGRPNSESADCVDPRLQGSLIEVGIESVGKKAKPMPVVIPRPRFVGSHHSGHLAMFPEARGISLPPRRGNPGD